MVVAFPALDVISQHLYTVGARYLMHIFPAAGTFTSVIRESRRHTPHRRLVHTSVTQGLGAVTSVSLEVHRLSSLEQHHWQPGPH